MLELFWLLMLEKMATPDCHRCHEHTNFWTKICLLVHLPPQCVQGRFTGLNSAARKIQAAAIRPTLLVDEQDPAVLDEKGVHSEMAVVVSCSCHGPSGSVGWFCNIFRTSPPENIDDVNRISVHGCRLDPAPVYKVEAIQKLFETRRLEMPEETVAR